MSKAQRARDARLLETSTLRAEIARLRAELAAKCGCEWTSDAKVDVATVCEVHHRQEERVADLYERVQTARCEALEALITIMAAADGGEKAILDAARALLDKEPS